MTHQRSFNKIIAGIGAACINLLLIFLIFRQPLQQIRESIKKTATIIHKKIPQNLSSPTQQQTTVPAGAVTYLAPQTSSAQNIQQSLIPLPAPPPITPKEPLPEPATCIDTEPVNTESEAIGEKQDTNNTSAATQPQKSTLNSRSLKKITLKNNLSQRSLKQRSNTQQSASAKKTLTLADLFKAATKQQALPPSSGQLQTSTYAGNGIGTLISCNNYGDKVIALVEQIIRNVSWNVSSRENMDISTILNITIAKDGSLTRTWLTDPTPLKQLNEYILAIPKSVGLFPKIPEHMNRQYITISIPFGPLQIKAGSNVLGNFYLIKSQGYR